MAGTRKIRRMPGIPAAHNEGSSVGIAPIKKPEAFPRVRAAQSRLVADTTAVMFARCSRDLRYLFVNRACAEFFGREPDQIEGELIRNILGAKAFKTIQPYIKAVLRGKSVEFEAQVPYAARGPRSVRAVYTPELDKRGAPGGWVEAITDVTELERLETKPRKAHSELRRRVRQTQESLRSTEKNLEAFFEHSPLGLLWVGPKGQIRRVNEVALELLGCTLKQCMNRRIQDFYADPKRCAYALKRLSRREVLRDHRAHLLRADATVRHVLIDANGWWKRGRMVHSHWFVRDITERIELQREILVIAERERQRIGRDLHDDLCQQLTGVEFLSQTLAGQLASHSPSEADRACKIAQTVRKAITCARNLVRGLAPVAMETDGLTGVLHELADHTRRLFEIDCRFHCRKPDMRVGPALGIHLFRIAQEAVSNALKHGRAKRVVIGLAHRNHRLVLAVTDDGTGMPPQCHQTKGMGLKVMDYRARVIGGTLELQRNPKGGVTVVCSVNDAIVMNEPKPTL